jgi:hypothetical protein
MIGGQKDILYKNLLDQSNISKINQQNQKV